MQKAKKLEKNSLKNSNKKSLSTPRPVALIILNISVLVAPIAFLLVFFLPSYFPFTAGTVMVFSGSDGNCVVEGVALGSHCFGDYGVPINFIQNSSNPWSADSSLAQVPPLNMLLLSFFAFMSNSLNPAFALTLFLKIGRA
jgi:hypothetical protein